MKYLKYGYIVVLFFILTGCMSEEIDMPKRDKGNWAYVDGDKVIVELELNAQEMGIQQTRVLQDNPDYQDMHLYLVEFADNGSPLQNTYITTYEPLENSEVVSVDKVTYKIELNATSKSRILHLIALPKGTPLNVSYGIEASVIPNLQVRDQVPAYWRRFSFPSGYAISDENGDMFPTSELLQLKNVALVRNYSKISMINNAENFELKGFAIINNPTSGSIAPYKTATYEFPDFLNENQKQIAYNELSTDYSGFSPEGITFTNLESGPVELNEGVLSQFIYERPFNSIRHTYLIIKGRRISDDVDSYYKLDIGKNDNDGIFRYYGLLRNFNYNIILNSVAQKGYATIDAAIQGVVYNNFSFDIGLSSMLNISDGDEVVYVNFTTAVLTDPNEEVLEFKYRYRSLSAVSPTYNNDDVSFIGLTEGSVIREVDYGRTNDENGWRSVKITCYPAQTETRTQSFTIVKKSGLGRTINLILHRKWTLQNVKEFPGTLENWDETTEDEGEVGDAVGSDFTIFFDVPDNLEEAMFPLVFTLEADRQNMENNPLGALIVTSGPSGFDGVQGRRIKYEKSVSWTQYNDPLLDDPSDNGTAIPNADGTTTHRVRCRFRTTTDLTNLPFDESITNVRITNDNFNVALVQYHREQ
ncbi:MAG: hypothetical protein K2L45_07815 [Muribaculaceae bacterium]|nr:hypothetical protein [Muribaculaceae bacterium]MDE6631903.1 hypothetical protein [Muribaculaceae bacterium]